MSELVAVVARPSVRDARRKAASFGRRDDEVFGQRLSKTTPTKPRAHAVD